MGCPYQYKDLATNQIRLLELLPDEEKLIGRIRHYDTDIDHSKDPFQLRCAPAYNALSHHWDPKPKPGDPKHVLLVKEEDTTYELSIRPSLAAALEAIRGKMRTDHWSHFLWIDAICIDQCSAEDKDKQLPTIGDVYTNAITVIVWLGGLDPDLARAISFCRRLQELDQWKKFLSCEEHHEDWKSLVLMTRNPWFTRLWIVQEIAAARDAMLLAGHECVSWNEFAGALSLLVSQREAVRSEFAKAGRFAREGNFLGDMKLSAANSLIETRGVVLRKRANGVVAEHMKSLEALLTSLSMFEVSEAHDTVYAILWLSNDASQSKKKNFWGPNHHFNVSTTNLASLADLQKQHVDKEDPKSGRVKPSEHDLRRVHTEVDFSSPTPVFEMSGSLPRNVSTQYFRVPAQEDEQLQADQVLDRETGIIIDYKQPVYDLCKQVLSYIIKETKRLDIICYYWAPGPQKRDLESHPPRIADEEPHPTWLLHTKKETYAKRRPKTQYISKAVRRVNADPFVGKPGSGLRPYLACGRTRAEGAKIEGRVLHASGYAIAKVADVGNPALNAVIPFDWRKKVGWTDNNEFPPGRFWRTLVGNKGPDGQPPPPHFKLACRWAFQSGPEDSHLPLEDIRNDGDVEEPLKEFIDCCIPIVWNRKLLLSEQCPGRPESDIIGLGPSEAQVGDVMCILLGCAVPVLLRPQKTAKKASVNGARSCPRNGFHSDDDIQVNYTFVGECFVYGMMEGEVFPYADTHDITKQDFHIH